MVALPLVSVFDGVGFVDLGNVYLRASDFNPFDDVKPQASGFGCAHPFCFCDSTMDSSWTANRARLEAHSSSVSARHSEACQASN
jgi:hypothetical protein